MFRYQLQEVVWIKHQPPTELFREQSLHKSNLKLNLPHNNNLKHPKHLLKMLQILLWTYLVHPVNSKNKHLKMLSGSWITSNNHSSNKCKIWTACLEAWIWVVRPHLNSKPPLLKTLLASWIKQLHRPNNQFKTSHHLNRFKQIHSVLWVNLILNNNHHRQIFSVEWICKLIKLHKWFNLWLLLDKKYKNLSKNKNQWTNFPACSTSAVTLWDNKLLRKKKIICCWLLKATALKFKWAWIQ